MSSPGVFEGIAPGVPAVRATGPFDADGIDASTSSGTGVQATSGTGIGVSASSDTGVGVSGSSNLSDGVYGQSLGGIGVHAVGPGVTFNPTPPVSQAALFAEGGPNIGVFAQSDTATAVFAQGGTGIFTPHPAPGIGVHAVGGGTSATAVVSQAAVFAEGGNGIGVIATTGNGTAVSANSQQGTAVLAGSNEGTAVLATSNKGTAVLAESNNAVAVSASDGAGGTGVFGGSQSGIGVIASSGSEGVALRVIGKVEVQGSSVGSVTMLKGTSTLTVDNVAATANSLILLTPLADPQAFLWISARNAGSFTINASRKMLGGLPITYLIIN